MTRMSPKPSLSRRRARRTETHDVALSRAGRVAEQVVAAPQPSQALVQWRIGRAGHCTLVVSPAPAGSPPGAVDLTVELAHVPLRGVKPASPVHASMNAHEARRLAGEGGSADRIRFLGRGTVSRVSDEYRLSMKLVGVGSREAECMEFVAELSLLTLTSSGRSLLLANLPAQLGLRGGTYALCEGTRDALRSILHAQAAQRAST